MFAFITFIISLVFIVLLFTMKALELKRGRKIFLEKLFLKCDAWIDKTSLKIKSWWSHITFKNSHLLLLWIITHTKKTAITVKRRFDHKQSHFFAKKEDHNHSKNKDAVSFFLKDVAEYKKSLREGTIEK